MRISIITINYNHLDGLKKTYESVVSQTWADYEWIIIDGGSTDGSREFIEEHQDKFAYWCSEPDRGVYNAMNKGIAKAHGEYLNFMNSGDCFAYPNTLESIFSNEHTADILYGYMMRRTIDGEYSNPLTMKPELYWHDFYFDSLTHQSSFIKKGLFEKYGGYDESYRLYADWKFFAQVIVHCGASYEFIPLKISIYESDGLSDTVDSEEMNRLRHEMFPQIMLKEVPVLRAYHRLMRFSLFRGLCKLYRKYSNWRSNNKSPIK